MAKEFERGSVFSDDMKRPKSKGRPARSTGVREKKAEDLDDLFGSDDPDIPKEKRGGRMKITPWK